jgi:hypothetical protein
MLETRKAPMLMPSQLLVVPVPLGQIQTRVKEYPDAQHRVWHWMYPRTQMARNAVHHLDDGSKALLARTRKVPMTTLRLHQLSLEATRAAEVCSDLAGGAVFHRNEHRQPLMMSRLCLRQFGLI